MTIRKFEFKKSYEEIDIAGGIYKIYLDDESIKKMYTAFENFNEKAEKLDAVDVSKLDAKGHIEHFEKQKELFKECINLILKDEKAFDVLYINAGKSISNMVGLLNYLGDIIGEKYIAMKNRDRQAHAQKYAPRLVSNKKKGKRK